MIKIFIGYDPKEDIAYQALVKSIEDKTTIPFQIFPLNIRDLPMFDRYDERQSNEFSFTRFLVPYLSDFDGIAIYMDCDMMLREDLSEVLKDLEYKAVHVVKHDYTSKFDTKFLGAKQYNYPRKNWSSFVIWNCSHPSNKILIPEFINTVDAKVLHRFLFVNDKDIGDLDVKWNWLVGEYDNPPADVKNVHWTIGGPWFNDFKDSDFAQEWFELYRRIK